MREGNEIKASRLSLSWHSNTSELDIYLFMVYSFGYVLYTFDS